MLKDQGENKLSGTDGLVLFKNLHDSYFPLHEGEKNWKIKGLCILFIFKKYIVNYRFDRFYGAGLLPISLL